MGVFLHVETCNSYEKVNLWRSPQLQKNAVNIVSPNNNAILIHYMVIHPIVSIRKDAMIETTQRHGIAAQPSKCR